MLAGDDQVSSVLTIYWAKREWQGLKWHVRTDRYEQWRKKCKGI